MAKLYQSNLSRRDISARCGALGQVAGVRLMTLGDGVERGIRMLEFRTGSGLRFTVLVDRAMDIAECEFKGQAIGWNSPTGFRHPALHEYEGEGGFAWARSFSGLLVTCGLDHILGPETVPAENYGYPGKPVITHTLHGRISTIPAKLTGYGEVWDGDECTLWAEGVVRQATVFGENLQLTRRIEAKLGSNTITISDRVTNLGFHPTPHMYFLHFNLGYPLLDKGSRFLAPISDVVWAAHAGERYQKQYVGYDVAPLPIENFVEQVWQHETTADGSGKVPLALVNDHLGIGFEISIKKEQLPCLYQWQNFQAGEYALGVEPSTHHVKGNIFARERGEMIWLGHDDTRHYDITLRVLDGAADIAASERDIRAVSAQPTNPYPPLSNNHLPLRGPLRK